MKLRKRIFLTLDPSEKGGLAERVFETILVTIIILNIFVLVIDSVDEINQKYHVQLYVFEIFSVVFFTIEYVARIYSIVEHPKYRDPIKGRIKFIKSPIAIIDLLAFLPFYLTFIPMDLRLLRIFRLMALFRMFKVARYLAALNVFYKVVYDRKEQLILILLFIVFVLIIISSIMFYVEHPAQPEAFSSIPATMWWGVSTLTTVGYGDIVPITTLGKILGGLFALTGIGLFALPAGILSSGFYEMMHKKGDHDKCPHCGKDLHG
jgi:voltage-gated potassium channel